MKQSSAQTHPQHGDPVVTPVTFTIPKHFCNTSFPLEAVALVEYRGFEFYVTKHTHTGAYSCVERTLKGSPFGKNVVDRLKKGIPAKDFLEGAIYYPSKQEEVITMIILLMDDPYFYDQFPLALKAYRTFLARTRHNIDHLLHTGIL